jgi:hypothetical protein
LGKQFGSAAVFPSIANENVAHGEAPLFNAAEANPCRACLPAVDRAQNEFVRDQPKEWFGLSVG